MKLVGYLRQTLHLLNTNLRGVDELKSCWAGCPLLPLSGSTIPRVVWSDGIRAMTILRIQYVCELLAEGGRSESGNGDGVASRSELKAILFDVYT